MLDVFADAEALAHAAAKLFAAHARQAVALRGRFSVALAGGDTPRRLYERLSQQPYRSAVPWHYAHLFWGDERCVPQGDPHSNCGMARRLLLDHLPLLPDQIHPVRGELPPQRAADEYEQVLRAFFPGAGEPRFDLVLLGLGDDGHTASLLPGSDALDETIRWTAVAKRSEETYSRVTLTARALNAARTLLFMVSGSRKAAMLKAVLQSRDTSQSYPAQWIRPDAGELIWYADRAAAAQLEL